MSTQPGPPKIDAIIAEDADVAVVFRMSRRLVEQLVWNLETDQVISGQWIRAQLKPERCDLSPDGRYLLSYFIDWVRGQEWFAVSKVPYFSALVWWGHSTNTGGNGIQVERGRIVFEYFGDGAWRADTPADDKNLPPNVAFRPASSSQHFAMHQRLERRGWAMTEDPGPGGRVHLEKRGPKAVVAYSYTKYFNAYLPRSFPVPEWRLATQSGEVIRSWQGSNPHFLDIDHKGRVLFADKGCLYAWERFPDGEPTLIADLKDHQFREVEPPADAFAW